MYSKNLILLFLLFTSTKLWSQVYFTIENACKDVSLTTYSESLEINKIKFTEDMHTTSFTIAQNKLSSIEVFTLLNKPWSNILLTQPHDSLKIRINNKCSSTIELLNSGDYYRLRERERKNFSTKIDSIFLLNIFKAERNKNFSEVERNHLQGYEDKKEKLLKYYHQYVDSMLVKSKIKMLDIEKLSTLLNYKIKNNIISNSDYQKELINILTISDDSLLYTIPLVSNNILTLLYQITKKNPTYFSLPTKFEIIDNNLRKSSLQKNILLSLLQQEKNKNMFDSLYLKFTIKYDDVSSKRILDKYRNTHFSENNKNSLVLLNTDTEEVSLDSLIKSYQGKYIYIDLWATWCAPCIAEHSYSKNLLHSYKDKVVFLYFSIDNNFDQWKNSLAHKQADIEINNSFFMMNNTFKYNNVSFKINGIPRYILINKEGEVLDDNASRPSDIKTSQLFDNLK